MHLLLCKLTGSPRACGAGLPSAKPAPALPHYFIFILAPTDTFVMFYSHSLPSTEISWAIPWIAAGTLLNAIAFTTFSSFGTIVALHNPLCTTAKQPFHMRHPSGSGLNAIGSF